MTEQSVSGKKQGFLDPEPGCIVTEQIVYVTKQWWPRTKAMFSRAQRSASQYHVKMHSSTTTMFCRNGAIPFRNESESQCVFPVFRQARLVPLTY
ncbi:MAG: hypothetical protein DMG12_20870 [Acidobacteria bacterium]|nr:MAG: hypothetical protein DMG12_20870 [Acidobacteriota bacterium]